MTALLGVKVGLVKNDTHVDALALGLHGVFEALGGHEGHNLALGVVEGVVAVAGRLVVVLEPDIG